MRVTANTQEDDEQQRKYFRRGSRGQFRTTLACGIEVVYGAGVYPRRAILDFQVAEVLRITSPATKSDAASEVTSAVLVGWRAALPFLQAIKHQFDPR